MVSHKEDSLNTYPDRLSEFPESGHQAGTQVSCLTSAERYVSSGRFTEHVPRQVVRLPKRRSLSKYPGKLSDFPETGHWAFAQASCLTSPRLVTEQVPRQVVWFPQEWSLSTYLSKFFDFPDSGISLGRLIEHVHGHSSSMCPDKLSNFYKEQCFVGETHQACTQTSCPSSQEVSPQGITEQVVWPLLGVVSYWGDSLSTYLGKLSNFSCGDLFHQADSMSTYPGKLSDSLGTYLGNLSISSPWEQCLIRKASQHIPEQVV